MRFVLAGFIWIILHPWMYSLPILSIILHQTFKLVETHNKETEEK